MKTNIFNLRRVGLLFQRYFIERSRSELIYWGIMAIVFMFFRNNIPGMFGIILVAGIFYAARFSKEIHHSANGIAYFMIPATQLEKLTVGIVMTTLYYFVMMMIVYVVGNLTGTFLNNILASMDFLPNAFFHHSSLQWKLFEEAAPMFPESSSLGNSWIVFIFLVYQSIFLFGGIYFKKNQTFITLLAIILFYILLLIFIQIEIVVILGGFDNFMPHGKDMVLWSKAVLNTAKIIYSLLPLFFWVVSYFRLTEKQV